MFTTKPNHLFAFCCGSNDFASSLGLSHSWDEKIRKKKNPSVGAILTPHGDQVVGLSSERN